MFLEHNMYLKYFHTTPFYICKMAKLIRIFFLSFVYLLLYNDGKNKNKYNHFKTYCYCWRYGNCTYLLFTLLSNSITFSKLPQLTDNYEVFVSLGVTIMCLIDTTMMVCIICICNLWRTLFGKNMYLTEIHFATMCHTL